MQLNFVRRGRGEPLVLLHGIGDSSRAWSRVLGRLARECDVWALDLPGFGRSPELADGEPPTIANLASAVATFMREQGVERFHVTGNSMGGAIALQLGYDGVAQSVCALSPVGFESPLERVWSRVTLTATRHGTRMLLPAADTLTRSPIGRRLIALQMVHRGERYPPEDLAATVRDAATCPAFMHALGPITAWDCPAEPPPCPTTIAWGEHDRLLLYGPQSRRARERLPTVRHVTLHGCGHIPMWDDPEQVAAVVLQARAR